MKRFFVALALVCAIAFPNIASAGTGMYLAPKFMMAFQNTGTVERSGMGGFGTDKYSQFTLGGAYVGAGLGFAFNYFGVDAHDNMGNNLGSQDERRTNFAWNVGGGVAFAVNDQVSIDAQYRYVDLGYTEVSSNYGGESQSIGIRPYNHEIMLGLRWGF